MFEWPQTRQKSSCAPTRAASVCEPFKTRTRTTAGLVRSSNPWECQVRLLEEGEVWWWRPKPLPLRTAQTAAPRAQGFWRKLAAPWLWQDSGRRVCLLKMQQTPFFSSGKRFSEAPVAWSLEHKSQKSLVSFVANKELLGSLKWSFVPTSERAVPSSSLHPPIGVRAEHRAASDPVGLLCKGKNQHLETFCSQFGPAAPCCSLCCSVLALAANSCCTPGSRPGCKARSCRA